MTPNKNKCPRKAILTALLFFPIIIGACVYLILSNSSKKDLSGNNPDNQDRPKINFSASKETARKIMDKSFNATTDDQNSTYYIDDLNGDGKPEIIMAYINPDNEGYYAVSTINDNNGDFKKIAQFKYQEMYRGTPSIARTEDIDNDEIKEIFMDLNAGGAYTELEGIMDVDFAGEKLDWVKYASIEDSINNAIFPVGASVANRNDFVVIDLDNDQKKEIIEIYGNLIQDGRMLPSGLEETQILKKEEMPDTDTVNSQWWVYDVKSYEWNETIFAFDMGTTKLMLDKIEKGEN